MKKRILYKDSNSVKCSTSAWVVWSHNHLLQRRQFATDGVLYFYQPTTSSLFIIVGEHDMPKAAQETLAKERGG